MSQVLIAIELNLYIALGMNILTLILPIHEHRITFHFFVSYYNFLLSTFYSFQSIGLSLPWLILLPGVFFWCDCALDFSDSSLLVYRNATEFCISILCPAALLNSLISSNSFFVESLGFYTYRIVPWSSANSDPAIPVLGIYLKNMKTLIWKDICTSVFTAPLFTIAKIWKQR